MSKEKIRIIRGLDLLVIDEISMVRADLLDSVDDVLRRYRDRSRPFGGVQLLMIGDLQQLPPVVTDAEVDIMRQNYRSPYFFDSHALQNYDYVTLELDHVYRQSDSRFLDILNAVRDNRADARVLEELNSRYIRSSIPMTPKAMCVSPRITPLPTPPTAGVWRSCRVHPILSQHASKVISLGDLSLPRSIWN